jgi:hypothetical protein
MIDMTNDARPPADLSLVEGDREALERELLWNIALDGDRARREQLCRMLTPAANSQLTPAPDGQLPP